MSMSNPELDPKLADTRPGAVLRMRMWSPPDPPVRHRALHPVETMGDITLGLAVVTAAVLVDRTSSGIGMALTIAALSFSVWHSFVQVANRVSLRRANVRWSLLLVAVMGVAMAISTPDVMGRGGIAYTAAYWIARIALARAVWARPEFGYGVNPYSMSAFFTGPLLAAGCAAEGDARLAIWVSAAIHDIAVPFVLRNRAPSISGDAEHMADRSSLGVGAMVLGGGAMMLIRPDSEAAWPWWLAVAGATVLVGAVWWAYVSVLRPAQLAPQSDAVLGGLVVMYAHLALALGAVLAYGAVRLVLAGPLRLGDWWAAGILASGLLVAYGGMAGVCSWLLGRVQWWLWLGVAAGAVVVLAGYGWNLAILGAAAVLAAVVATKAVPLLPARPEA